MNEFKFWLKLTGGCLAAGAVIFLLTLQVTIKGGKVDVPDLNGLSRGSAEYELKSRGLRMKVVEERFSTESAYGRVLKQDLEPGTTIKKGRIVAVILSKGTKLVSVPDLAGMASSRQARLLLEQNGLKVRQENHVYHPRPRDTVLAQIPEAGLEVARDEAVSLLISLGPRVEGWVMPDLSGLRLVDSRRLLKMMDLIVRQVDQVDLPGRDPGAVVSQSVTPGAKVEEKTLVNLSVNKGGAMMKDVWLAEILYQVPGDGVIDRRVMITVSDEMGERVLHNAMEKPGSRLRLQPRVWGKAVYTVMLAGKMAVEEEVPGHREEKE